MWILGHRSMPGNESADLLAKESLHFPDPFLICNYHYINLYSKFKKVSKEKAINILWNILRQKAYIKKLDTFQKLLLS